MENSVISQWPLDSNSGHDKGIKTKIAYFVFLGLGSVFSGILSDNFGRKRTVSLFTCLLILSGFITSVAWNREVFNYLWLLVGMGIFGIHVPTYVRVIEILPTKKRLIVALLLFGTAWMIARGAAILVAWTTKDWSLILFTLSLCVCAMLMVKYVCFGKFFLMCMVQM